ncbi:signal transduction histidine kinase/ActR/RegA family two-component response regulator [Caulobacter ginsengisoli]|uniref:histidine kinase n=1 Tax=Caulobacter ginsengisoli TaxID=400775 RepID=A0ABU0IQ48_9CAUL|nr:ATP-binding protein [Caulobacter ginsengisoli]MDQ0464139.1 signal transduction histidine kinase/ActR/RegA family two-component response regulator [Caulobacter ginsengisoli]
MPWGLGFDDGFDAVACETRRLAPARAGAAVVVAFLAAINMGLMVGLVWGGFALACELWTWIAATPQAQGRATNAHRWHFLVTGLAFGALWVSLASLYWTGFKPGFQFDALLVWAGVLLNGISFAFRSRLGLALFAAPMALAMVIEPLLVPRYHGIQQLTVVVGALTLVAYGFICANQNLQAARALAETQALLKEQKQAAETASQAKSAFLAMMSHELRTPMNGVLGMAHALQTTPLDARQQDYVRTVIRSGDVLMAILNDILDLSKIEAGRLELEAAPFDLRDLAARVCDLWTPSTADKGLTLELKVDPAAAHWVVGDAMRVRQILLNLVSNAVKFTDQGAITLAIEADPDGRVALSVRDTGIGIPRDVQKRLFQSFTQADVSTSRIHGGTGLGLSICRRLAELMGGDIALTSTLGRGSTFRVTLPLALAPVPGAAEAQAGPAAEPARAIKVLVVDDHPTNRAVAAALLGAVGADVASAADGLEALDLLMGERFDLILMDIHMPRLDGVETLRRIRAGEGLAADAVVVALTADAMTGERERLLGLGFDDYLSKPIQPAALLDVVARLSEATQGEDGARLSA